MQSSASIKSCNARHCPIVANCHICWMPVISCRANMQSSMFRGSLQPLVVEISSFLDASDCQHIIDKALPHIKKSTVKHMDHEASLHCFCFLGFFDSRESQWQWSEDCMIVFEHTWRMLESQMRTGEPAAHILCRPMILSCTLYKKRA